LVDLQYPVDEVLLAIRSQQRENDIASNAVGSNSQRRRARKRSLPKPEKIFLAVHRADNSVYFKRLDAEAFNILRALRDGKRLSEAVESIDWGSRSDEQAAENLQAWFALWSTLGWFCKTI
jgi:hypothetical protein